MSSVSLDALWISVSMKNTMNSIPKERYRTKLRDSSVENEVNAKKRRYVTNKEPINRERDNFWRTDPTPKIETTKYPISATRNKKRTTESTEC